ncbi:MAG: DNA replication/repair protein RecF [Candidatus Zixiibacteriota bacterium]
MIITSIKITGFRNFTALESDFVPGANIFFGNNGSGKTNFLESLFVLCLGRSQLGVPDTVLLKNDEEFYRLEGVVEKNGRPHDIAIACQHGGRKKITVDGVAARPSELFENFCAVSTGPEDSVILSGSPSARRIFLDMYLSQLSGKYLNDLTAYHKVLAQKNAALKNDMDPTPFEPQLIGYGARVILKRIEFLAALRQKAAGYYTDISEGEPFDLIYKPTLTNGDDFFTEQTPLAEVESRFEQCLEEYYDKERYLKTAIVGPHRDEIYFEIAGLPARQYGSQGQWRTAAISLKLAVYHLLKETKKAAPVLLLDEIFAELDRHRVESLIDAFGGFDQLFLTTAGTPPERLTASGRCYRIVKGAIEEVI